MILPVMTGLPPLCFALSFKPEDGTGTLRCVHVMPECDMAISVQKILRIQNEVVFSEDITSMQDFTMAIKTVKFKIEL